MNVIDTVPYMEIRLQCLQLANTVFVQTRSLTTEQKAIEVEKLADRFFDYCKRDNDNNDN